MWSCFVVFCFVLFCFVLFCCFRFLSPFSSLHSPLSILHSSFSILHSPLPVTMPCLIGRPADRGSPSRLGGPRLSSLGSGGPVRARRLPRVPRFHRACRATAPAVATIASISSGTWGPLAAPPPQRLSISSGRSISSSQRHHWLGHVHRTERCHRPGNLARRFDLIEWPDFISG